MAGRPTDYNKDIQAKADAYAEGGFVDCGDVVPSRAGLALELGISRTTLANWEKHPEFLVTLDRIAYLQERISLNGGLRGELNSTIVKLLLANHGYSDKLQQELTGANGGPVAMAVLDAEAYKKARKAALDADDC